MQQWGALCHFDSIWRDCSRGVALQVKASSTRLLQCSSVSCPAGEREQLCGESQPDRAPALPENTEHFPPPAIARNKALSNNSMLNATGAGSNFQWKLVNLRTNSSVRERGLKTAE